MYKYKCKCKDCGTEWEVYSMCPHCGSNNTGISKNSIFLEEVRIVETLNTIQDIVK